MKGVRAPRWSTPDDIVAGVRQLWDSGALLRARFENASLFPHELRLRQPGVADMGEQFDAVREWIGALGAMSRDSRGYGYALAWREINHRQLGRNSIPVAAVIPSEDDALRMIGRTADARRFDRLAAATLGAFPALRAWLSSQPLKLLEHADAWERILAVLRWFVAHPRPGIYLRQLDIEGVDTKFIEARKGLFAELLDQLLPQAAVVASANGVRQFDARYGLLAKPALIRFRLLDPGHYIAGLSDLTVPVAQFAALASKVERVFVTENEVNALAFPEVRSSMVVFGGGYGIDRLAQVAWLRDRELLYWGDIDTHGFAILDRLRANLPHVRSLLMDAQTLHVHRALWGSEDPATRYTGELGRLHDEERQLFLELRNNVHAQNLRMEQERVGYTWAVEAIRKA
jgi:hypothetical protein